MKLLDYLQIAKEFPTLKYVEVPVSDIDFQGNFANIHNYSYNYDGLIVAEEMRDALCKYVGMSPPMNKALYNTDPTLWKEVLTRLYSLHSEDTVILVIEKLPSSKYIKGICQASRPALDNTTFIKECISHFEDVDVASIEEVDYASDNTTASVIVLMNEWETEYAGVPRFKIGVVLTNNEENTVTARLVIKRDHQEYIYFPSKVYGASSGRYDKRTKDAQESLQMLLLKVSEDFLTHYIKSRAPEVVMYLDDAAKKHLSLAEFDALRNVIVNAAHLSEMDEEEIGDILSELAPISDFETLYGSLGTDYLWKATAFSDIPMNSALNVIGKIPEDHKFYPECIPSIREILGEYLVKPRNCQFVAKRL